MKEYNKTLHTDGSLATWFAARELIRYILFTMKNFIALLLLMGSYDVYASTLIQCKIDGKVLSVKQADVGGYYIEVQGEEASVIEPSWPLCSSRATKKYTLIVHNLFSVGDSIILYYRYSDDDSGSKNEVIREFDSKI